MKSKGRAKPRAVRVQLRRAKGWRMPPNTVKVDRTTKWGNPFKVCKRWTAEQAVARHTYLLGGYICLCADPSMKQQEEYIAMLKAERANGWPSLRGKNLACWCRLDAPCHADLLLDIANRRIVPLHKGGRKR